MITACLCLCLIELAKMLALSYDIRHPGRYLWLTLSISLSFSLFVLFNLFFKTFSSES